MLKEQPFINVLIINLLIGAVWHYASFFLCISISKTAFDPNRKMYMPHKWENNGKFYNDVLKINRWKDFLPQHIGKDGFSKDHIDDISLEYIDEFIMETCRGEWNHSINCMFTVVLFLINDFFIAILFMIFLFIGNVPFIIIQRYNRFRLQKLRKTIIKVKKRKDKKFACPIEKSTQKIRTSPNNKADPTVNQT